MQLFRFYRLDQEVGEPFFLGTAAVAFVPASGHGDEDGLTPEAPAHGKAVHHRQAKLRHHNVRAVGPGDVQGGRPAVGDRNVVAPGPEQQGGAVRRVGVVVHDQHAERRVSHVRLL